MNPVVLDLDASVGALPGEHRIGLRERQETLRFSCTLRQMQALRITLQQQLPALHGTVFTGSGDFHHLSWPLIERCVQPNTPPVRVLVFDNHPDNMRFPWGVHCGSWVRRVAALQGVARVDVVGITSGDIGRGHAWENYLTPLRSGKLRYWSVGVDTGWSRWLGLQRAFRNFGGTAALVDALCTDLAAGSDPVYVSIDKDVFSTDVVHTNWDQGRLDEAGAMRVLDAVQGRVVGSDVTGDVSAYVYKSRFKRWLSSVDAQDSDIDPLTLRGWQAAQHALNLRLLQRLQAAAPR
jgi:hypothetical protein